VQSAWEFVWENLNCAVNETVSDRVATPMHNGNTIYLSPRFLGSTNVWKTL
jgi:hypothetical protein